MDNIICKFDNFFNNNNYIYLINISSIYFFLKSINLLINILTQPKIYYYYDNENKTLLRGSLHLNISFLLSYYIIYLCYFYYSDNNFYNFNNFNNFYKYIFYLYLKLLSYYSSAFFHCSNESYYKKQFKLLHFKDIFFIGFSIYSNIFILQNNYFNILLFLFYSISIIFFHLKNKTNIRIFLIFLFTLYSEFIYLYSFSFDYESLFSIILYKLSFICYIFNKLFDNKIKFIWHKKFIYGFHEDFHLLLFLSDLTCLLKIFNYLKINY